MKSRTLLSAYTLLLVLPMPATLLASPASFMPQRNPDADLAGHITNCEPFGELFTHRYTGDTLWREVEGVVDDRCIYTEDMPGNARITCRHPLDRLAGIADLYANSRIHEGLSVESRSRLVDGGIVTTTTYRRNGERVEHPLVGVFEDSECITARLPDDAESRVPAGTVYGEPYGTAPAGFKLHELPFQIPASEMARPEDRSAEFWAVVLRTAAPCSILEPERAELQTYFQQNRVFMTRFGCDDEFGSDEYVTYDGIDSDSAFLAIYGGTRREHAEWLLAIPMLKARYGDENMRVAKMRAVLVYP